MHMVKKINVTDYKDPVSFLFNWITLHAKINITEFSKRAGLPNTRLVSDIIKRRKKIKVKHAEIFQNVLKLSKQDYYYFLGLVKYYDVESKEEKQFFKNLLEDYLYKPNTDRLNKKLFGNWKGRSEVVGDIDSVPAPFNTEETEFHIDGTSGELILFSEDEKKNPFKQFIPYNQSLVAAKTNLIDLKHPKGVERSVYVVDQVSEGTTHFDIRWQGLGWWGTWKVFLNLAEADQKLFLNFHIDGSHWGKNSCYGEYFKEK